MKNTESLQDMPVGELIDRFKAIALAQFTAVNYNRTNEYRELYDMLTAVKAELKSRKGDQRRNLMSLYVHSNAQVRLEAARATLAIAYPEARSIIQTIADSGEFPQAGDAGMSLSSLDRGIYSPT